MAVEIPRQEPLVHAHFSLQGAKVQDVNPLAPMVIYFLTKSKEHFLNNPCSEFYNLGQYPKDWILLAFESEQFREWMFSMLVNHVGEGHSFADFYMDGILKDLRQELRDELFLLCNKACLFCTWRDGYVANVGPVNPDLELNVVMKEFYSQDYRQYVFRLIAEELKCGKSFKNMGWGNVLPQLPQAFRDELYRYCCKTRPVIEWHADFIDAIGPVTPGVASEP